MIAGVVLGAWTLFVGFLSWTLGFRRGYRYSDQGMTLRLNMEKLAQFRRLTDGEKRLLTQLDATRRGLKGEK